MKNQLNLTRQNEDEVIFPFTEDLSARKFNMAKVNQESFCQHFPFDCENEEQSNKNQNLTGYLNYE